MEHKAFPSDVTEDEWALVAPYLTLSTENVRMVKIRSLCQKLGLRVSPRTVRKYMPRHCIGSPGKRYPFA